MREILFRAKVKEEPNDWVEGYLSKCEREFIISNDDGLGVFINPDTICQYTGLTDKNGNKIWENDILFAKEPYIPTCPFSIRYNQETISYVGLYDGFGKEFELSKELLSCCEVIGNIFDNPKLLKGE